jgi:glutamate racemase
MIEAMSKLRNEAPIGVFDSGLGGLTVLRALAARLPREDFVYLGDTARVPYGTRTVQTVLNYSHACARVLRDNRIKMLVVACHTVSACALDALAAELFVPSIGAIVPGTRAGLAVSLNKRLGVIATAGTLRSGAYLRAVGELDRTAQVFIEAAPLLVPMVEEGWLDREATRLTARAYLEPLAKSDVDALVLGSTHYSLLMPLIADELAALSGKAVPVIDSAPAIAEEVATTLESRQLATARDDPGKLRIIFTDMPDDFGPANRFLGKDLAQLSVSAVDV